MTAALPRASIIIPAHNSAARIGIPLEALAAQDADRFEVVVVDNASTDDTAHTVRNHPAVAALHARGIGCRVVREERKGLTHARIRGVREARSEFVCFLDDDTAPDPQYVSEALAAFADPDVGLLVSRVFPRYEVPPSPSIARREHLFAINHRLGDTPIDWEAAPTFVPTLGAGMWVRRGAFLQAVPWESPDHLLSDRLGSSLLSGGDIEIGYLIGKAGYKRVYRPRLKLTHFIPQARLQTRYMCRLITGIVRSEMTLDCRYVGRTRGTVGKVLDVARLAGAALALPVLLIRRDSLRETLFVLVSRWARVMGPY